MYGEVKREVEGEIEDGAEAVMEGVEHLGKYVFEMTKAKVEALKAGGGQLPINEVAMEDDDDADREENVVVGEGEVNDEVPEEPEEVPV
jgi:intron-binding protein aquarius